MFPAILLPASLYDSWLKPGAVVIDVGINSVDDPTSKKGKNIVSLVLFCFLLLFSLRISYLLVFIIFFCVCVLFPC